MKQQIVPVCYVFVLLTTLWRIDHVSLVSAQTWQRHVIDNSFRGADGVRLGDFDQDGLLDVVTGWEESGLVRLYLNPGPQKVTETWPAVTIGKAGSPEDAVPYDIDGDGKLDVVSCHEGQVRRVYAHRHLGGNLLDPNNWSSEPWTQADGQAWMFAAPIRLGPRTQSLVVGSKGNNGSITLLIRAKTAQVICRHGPY